MFINLKRDNASLFPPLQLNASSLLVQPQESDVRRGEADEGGRTAD